MLKPLFYLLFILAFTVTYSQGEEQNETSNIQNYTPSKLLEMESGILNGLITFTHN
jgi:hypothetical protein